MSGNFEFQRGTSVLNGPSVHRMIGKNSFGAQFGSDDVATELTASFTENSH